MTSNPARRFGLTGRGEIKTGNFADLVVFDEARINDQSSFEDPRASSVGIHHVLVNGELALENERLTGAIAGEAIP